MENASVRQVNEANGEPNVTESWIEAIVDEYQGPLCLYAGRFLRGPDRARDVVQDVFLRLCEQEPRPEGRRLKAWLFTVCRNRALDVLRKEKRMRPLNAESDSAGATLDPSPHEALEQQEAEGEMLVALGRLPENQKEVIRLRFQQGLSYKEISRVAQLTVGNVGYLIHTGLKRLREALDAQAEA